MVRYKDEDKSDNRHQNGDPYDYVRNHSLHRGNKDRVELAKHSFLEELNDKVDVLRKPPKRNYFNDIYYRC